MPTPRKFQPGRKVRSMTDLANRIEQGCWLYWFADGRPKHPGFISSMQFRALVSAVAKGRLRVAVPVSNRHHHEDAA